MKSVNVLIACLGLGCGSVMSPPGGDDVVEDGDFTIAVSKPSVAMAIGKSDTLTITVVRGGSIGDIALEAPNLPPGVSVAFATQLLHEGVSSTEATITLGAGAVAGSNEIDTGRC